jgi:KamA family protein
VSDYYRSLIDWDDPRDPLRAIVTPSEREQPAAGVLDASDEASNTRVPGLQHKYSDTALLLVTDECAGYCRYCFRKRLFLGAGHEAQRDCGPALAYIREHPEITDVLLTGGDPLTMPTDRLGEITESLLAIEHVRTIRLGSKMPAFDPERITADRDLATVVRSVTRSGRSFSLMAHFDHPRELTGEAVAAIAALRAVGAMCVNQCPLAQSINDDPGVLAELFQACTDAGCPQYYIFQCRPTRGNSAFLVPLVRAAAIVEQAQRRVSGLSRRARFCLSHASGKIEVCGADDRHLYARYHRAKHAADAGRFLVFVRDDEAVWFDDLVPAGGVA